MVTDYTVFVACMLIKQRIDQDKVSALTSLLPPEFFNGKRQITPRSLGKYLSIPVYHELFKGEMERFAAVDDTLDEAAIILQALVGPQIKRFDLLKHREDESLMQMALIQVWNSRIRN